MELDITLNNALSFTVDNVTSLKFMVEHVSDIKFIQILST